jgi:hypothetical protein
MCLIQPNSKPLTPEFKNILDIIPLGHSPGQFDFFSPFPLISIAAAIRSLLKESSISASMDVYSTKEADPVATFFIALTAIPPGITVVTSVNPGLNEN